MIASTPPNSKRVGVDQLELTRATHDGRPHGWPLRALDSHASLIDLQAEDRRTAVRLAARPPRPFAVGFSSSTTTSRADRDSHGSTSRAS